ncbi:MAG: putative toxin-antitoxin system toxin component, PIN family [Fulvivirga sp.]|uniref:putative toxin-antitoxin system toxin component, PIN family n=1 Tax=Fulvivirga sp. TaxID=1931237 RepID=UPI0032ED4C27
MAKSPERIIIDTNLWIHFLISKELSSLDKHIFSKRVRLIFCQELLDEFLEVVSRPKLQKYFSKKDVVDLLNLIDIKADFIKVVSEVDRCRDPKDNFLLSLALDASADFILTGYKDLLELRAIEKTKIVTVTQYLSIIQ